jgi:hypothetical protein
MREALGGESRLNEIRTLLIRGSNTYSDNSVTRFTYRISLPNAYQEFLERQSITFTVIDDKFWRFPAFPPSVDPAGPHGSVVSRFADWCLLMLGRASSQVAMSASVEKGGSGRPRLILTGDVTRTLELDAHWRPRVLENPVDMYSPGDRVPVPKTRRLVIEKWAQNSGIWFPAEMSIAFLPRPPSVKIRFSEIQVNEGVNRSDFAAPSITTKK